MAKGALPLEQTVTIINNSGKLISTGKHLVSIWKEAQNSYREKKAELKLERTAQRAPVQRSQTFDPSRSLSRRHHHHHDDLKSEYDDDKRSRRTYDDQSVASSRRNHGSRGTRHHRELDARSQLALTENNLKTLSEVSSTASSRPPVAYRSPYDEAASRAVVSRGDIDCAEMRSIAPTQRTQVARTRSNSELALQKHAEDNIDMHLAYGDIPPDLHTRTDLDPKAEEDKAEELVHKIEDLLDEAHCAQHSATAIIKHLQERPDAAAAVALTLAELSSFVAKASPAFVTFLKGASPAVFALLASPQFLIGTGIAVGVTVVMFGGWKIIQKVAEGQMARSMLSMEQAPPPIQARDVYDNGVDEALVLEKMMEEELNTIETWRRGIVPETADLELITPQADRATRERRARDPKDPMDDFDSRSRRSSRTHKTSKTHKSHRSSKHENDSSDKKSSRGDAASVAPSSFSKKSSRKNELKTIDEGRSVKSEELPFRPRPRVHNNMLKALFKPKKEQEAVLA